MGVKIEDNFKLVTESVQQVLDSNSVQINPLAKVALLVEHEAKRSMRTGGGSKQLPSAPGSPPHTQTGNLRASINFAKDVTKRKRTRFIIGPTKTAWYGRLHEFGTGGRFRSRKALNVARRALGVRRKPVFPKRPFMRPALLRTHTKFRYMFENIPIARTSAGRRANRR